MERVGIQYSTYITVAKNLNVTASLSPGVMASRMFVSRYEIAGVLQMWKHPFSKSCSRMMNQKPLVPEVDDDRLHVSVDF